MRLIRDEQSEVGTFGRLLLDDGTVFCCTCEPPSPMPAGTYDVSLRYSPSHGYAVPGLKNVPGHNDIEIHAGNTKADTKDCVLPGDSIADQVKGSDGVLQKGVTNSRATFLKLMTLLGVPSYKDLKTWDDVKEFRDQNPGAGDFSITIEDAFNKEAV